MEPMLCSTIDSIDSSLESLRACHAQVQMVQPPMLPIQNRRDIDSWRSMVGRGEGPRWWLHSSQWKNTCCHLQPALFYPSFSSRAFQFPKICRKDVERKEPLKLISWLKLNPQGARGVDGQYLHIWSTSTSCSNAHIAATCSSPCFCHTTQSSKSMSDRRLLLHIHADWHNKSFAESLVPR